MKNWFRATGFRQPYPTHEALFEGLRALENRAILQLQTKALPTVRKLVRERGLDDRLVEELLNRGTLIFLQKIEAGSYVFQGHAPTTYLVEVIKRLALAASRKVKREVDSLDDHLDLADPDQEAFLRNKEAAVLVRSLLDHLGDPCARVIQLHHLDGYSDDEVVRRRMTAYSTTNSLKVKRSDCMKKLIKLAQQWKTVNSI
ncbi:MAG: sigma-70 family RNA polymerase sigma factor [Bacteroidota bacterium]